MHDRSHAPSRPTLRPLEVHRVDGGIVLTDPFGLVQGQVFVPEGLLPIVGRLDGEHTVDEIEAELRASGEDVPEGSVGDVVRQLDEGLLLDGELFRNTLGSTVRQFLASDVRDPAHVGGPGYPADPATCAAAVAAIVGPKPRVTRATPLRGLIAPHIDLARGAAGYRAAYAALAEHPPADLYVVLGTGHQGPSGPLTGLEHDWSTPLGRLRTDRAFVAAVHERLGQPADLDRYLHRAEHSIEFQMLFLAHLLAGREAEVAAFLCGALPSATGDPDGEEYVARIVEALRDPAARSGKQVCFVAGADLAHVGPTFGDVEPVGGERLARLARDDSARLAHLENGAPGAFHRAVVGDGNRDRVCSATAIYLTARASGGRAEILHYGQAPADDGSQVVSFCAARLGGESLASDPGRHLT